MAVELDDVVGFAGDALVPLFVTVQSHRDSVRLATDPVLTVAEIGQESSST